MRQVQSAARRTSYSSLCARRSRRRSAYGRLAVAYADRRKPFDAWARTIAITRLTSTALQQAQDHEKCDQYPYATGCVFSHLIAESFSKTHFLAPPHADPSFLESLEHPFAALLDLLKNPRSHSGSDENLDTARIHFAVRAIVRDVHLIAETEAMAAMASERHCRSRRSPSNNCVIQRRGTAISSYGEESLGERIADCSRSAAGGGFGRETGFLPFPLSQSPKFATLAVDQDSVAPRTYPTHGKVSPTSTSADRRHAQSRRRLLHATAPKAVGNSRQTRFVRAVNLRGMLGQVLKTARTTAGLTQEQLALNAGIDRTYLSELENDRKSPTLAMLFRIADALDVPASKLVARTEELMKRL